VLALVALPLGWGITDHLEQDDAFCTSCHLQDGRPLHAARLEDFRARPAASLAAAHAAAGNKLRQDGRFRCIDCHGGSGLLGRARVKLLSARDAFWYVTGRFEEPDAMNWPLWDRDCARCHPSFPEADEEDFHALAVHQVELGIPCVACHRAHVPGGLADRFFLHPREVRVQCARCHPELEEGAS